VDRRAEQTAGVSSNCMVGIEWREKGRDRQWKRGRNATADRRIAAQIALFYVLAGLPMISVVICLCESLKPMNRHHCGGKSFGDAQARRRIPLPKISLSPLLPAAVDHDSRNLHG